jgi:glycosyltransferase involved in cell wall biosynthesis
MSRVLHIIEPTLFDQSGHGFGYVQSLISANRSIGFVMHVWHDNRGKKLLRGLPCISHSFFFRPLRQVQKLWLYFRLLKQHGIVFISTSELWDLKILAFYSKHFSTQAQVALHFHQFKKTAKKFHALDKLSKQCKKFAIFAPTDKLVQIFQEHGFKQAKCVACPSFYPLRDISHIDGKFSRILYPGAARSDKGFPQVIKLLQHLRQSGNNMVFELQISPPNSQRYDAATEEALVQLKTIPTTNLIVHNNTLNQQQYLGLFNNAICLLLHDHILYQDKFSGVTLDAFYAGCPIITAKNTWMGDSVEKYQAGIALENYTNEAITAAINNIVENYVFYHNNAKRAAVTLRQLHDPKNTLIYLRDQSR